MEKYILTIFALSLSMASFAQSEGSFKGKIIEQSTKQPIIGATVFIDNIQLGAATDTLGIFTVETLQCKLRAIYPKYR